jgi:D-alanyl-D-alanine carboxypeptidase (penicillin-binding protein 5/6)
MTEKKESNEPILHEAPDNASFIEPILKNPEPGHMPVLRQLGVALFLLLFVFSTTYVGTLMALFEPEEQLSDVHVSTKLAVDTTTETETYTDPFKNVKVKARSAFVWDITEQKILFNKNADEVLPLASVTKLMTALVAYELLDDETMVNVTIDAIKTDGDSGLSDGETFSLKDITDMVLIASSNDGAAALGAAAGNAVGSAVDPDRLFVHAMNLRASELGLTNTRFKNATGLDISPTEAGAYSSARDVALLMEYLIVHYPQVTRLTTTDATRIYNENGEYHEVENTNEIVDEIEGLLASKTGYTELAGGNLVVAFEAGLNRPIVAVVLGSTFNERFSDILTLTESARQLVALQPE